MNDYVWKGKKVTKEEMDKITETKGEWQPTLLALRPNYQPPTKKTKQKKTKKQTYKTPPSILNYQPSQTLEIKW